MKRFKNVFFLMAIAIMALSFAACNNQPAQTTVTPSVDTSSQMYEGRNVIKNEITNQYELIRFVDPNGKIYPLNTVNDGGEGDVVTLWLDEKSDPAVWRLSEHGAHKDSLKYVSVRVLRRAGETLKKEGKATTNDKQTTPVAPPKQVDTTTTSAVVSNQQNATGLKASSPSPAPAPVIKKNTGVMTSTKK